ncbi:DUF6879 family protein [Herbihabitans rhizosphaerae]|uniref:DUF6879 family protein n=1 Tax=Herbihabitans rhizosphaerae TaxID=1872711 RepID=UPI001F5FC0C2|nr:DUF6879 family protein [Herbihabitans rhizosphaerae]
MTLGAKKFQHLFENYEHTAFRLEVRDRYNVSYETESVNKFLSGDVAEMDVRYRQANDWTDMVARSGAAGKLFERVRVVSEPFTDYTRYGLWSSQFTCGAGEDIRYLKRDQANGLPNHDYWLFDSRILVMMNFDDDDQPLEHEIIDDQPELLVQHNYWRDAAWHHAIRREDFVAQHNLDFASSP